MSLTDRFLHPIRSHPYLLIFAYFLVFCGCLSYPTIHFTSNTDSSFVAPTDSLSGTAQDVYSSIYGDSGKSIIVTVSVPEGEDVTTSSDAADFTSNLISWSANATQSCPTISESTSYFTLAAQGLTELGLNYVSSSKSTTFTYITYTCPITNTYVSDLRSYVNSNCPLTLTCGSTGIELFQIDILEGVENDLSRMDTTILPLALLTLAVVLGSLPIMLIPILNILITVTLSFGFMYPVTLSMQVVSFTPSVMMSLIIAMSIDYSLFLLSRVQDEISMGRTTHSSVRNMVEHAGHTIIASGSTLCVCFCGMLFFPMDMLRSVGVGATVSILVALGVNLTLTPAILYTGLGEKLLRPGRGCAKVCCAEEGTTRGVGTMVKREIEKEKNEGDERLLSGFEPQSSIDRYNRIDSELMYKSFWYRMARVLLQPKYGVPILLACVGLMMPVCVHFVDLKTSIGFDLLLPSASESIETFDDIGELFGEGTLSPYKILFDGPGPVTTAEAFDVMHEVVHELNKLPATSELTSFAGIAYLGGFQVNHTEYEAALLCGIECGKNFPDPGPQEEAAFQAARSLTALSESVNSPSGNATFTTVILNVDPFSNDGTQWLVDARSAIDGLKSSGALKDIEVYLCDGAGIEYDAVAQVYEVFPTLITATLVTVFVLMGVFFRSVIVPIRSVVSIALTLMFVFGLTVLVYQDGAFEFMDLACFSKTGYISWLPPVMTFSIVVGLGLDYDVFLISRVLEFRLDGYDSDSSVLAGIWKTGSVITCAGIIMGLAFAGLLMSEELLLNQTAFILVVSVLVDTFVVRTVLVPILLGVTEKYSWWPRALPAETVNLKNGENGAQMLGADDLDLGAQKETERI
ncbi:hypothetical protein TrVE_jg3060 [Triparma verrucosa]|uniref:SSD domain-containing protein n=1 Tax=Triparma verrucosa TaxID=1606542 RepID=A0A9W6ZAS2_9STRA|nr:hypothetical protein TrVE_jg3060 [Triparma verrucosa]